MSLSLRVLCIVGAAATFLIVTNSIRRSRMRMDDAIFWVAMSLGLVIVAVFPNIATTLSRLLGFQAPSNFVFLAVIAILLIKLFTLSTEVSALKSRVNELAQEEALLSSDVEELHRDDGSRQPNRA